MNVEVDGDGKLGANCSGGGGKLSCGVRDTGDVGDASLTSLRYCWCLNGVVRGNVLAPDVESQSSISMELKIPPSDLRDSFWKSLARVVWQLSISEVEELSENIFEF